MTDAPQRIRVAQDAEGFWTCREAVSGSQEYIRADLAIMLSDMARCPHCDGTGDVHRADGEWLGECDCGCQFRHAYDVEASPSQAFSVIQEQVARIATLEAEVSRLTALLDEAKVAVGPFADTADHDIGDDEADEDIFHPMTNHNSAMKITVGHMRAARAFAEKAGA